MTAFFVCVVSNVVFAGAVAIIALGLTRVWRSPHLAHALWLMVLFKLVTPPLICIPVDSFTSGESTQSSPTIASEPVSSQLSSSARGSLDVASQSLMQTPDLEEVVDAVRAMNIMWNSILANWPQWLLTAWIIGTGGFISIGLRRHMQLARVIAGGQAPDEMIVQDAENIARQIGLA